MKSHSAHTSIALRVKDRSTPYRVQRENLFRFFTPTISSRDKAEFCTQLSVLLQSRVSLHRSLEVLARQSKTEALRHVIQRVQREINKGNSLAKALAAQPDVFDQLFIVTAEVGQESGRLPDVLSGLALHLEKIDGLKRKVMQALAYPALVLSVASAAVLFLLIFIVPTFAEMFKSFQMELPSTTQAVLQVSDLLMMYGLYVLPVAACGVIIGARSLSSERLRERIHMAAMHLPFIGNVVLTNHVARFCRTLGTLLQSRVGLIDSLQITQRVTTLSVLRKEVNLILKAVQQGKAVAEPVVDSKFFPPMVAQMIAVGEETSELDQMLTRVAEYYEKDLDMRMDTISTLLEPVLVLLLGMVVAVILIAMYLPMFDLINVVGGSG